MEEKSRPKINREYLNPSRKLVDETVDWLCGGGPFRSRIRETAEGARSLAHILVIVPTAQSARNLRFALARRSAEDRGAILPPRIEMANALLEPRDVRTATEAEELAAMAEVLGTIPYEVLTSISSRVKRIYIKE